MTLILGELRKAGLVDHHRSAIHIVNRAGLEAASCECYATVKAVRAAAAGHAAGGMEKVKERYKR